ncbi:hypothetical protein JQ612_27705 [Bradyrhizobium manausense]|uniref:hypothetical protein n=1 Tax=Bradyrhizobium manausense TaxID=989370 RepID=UPI001BA9AF6F|nr:hypothetical protein [Bradyrhizobium manausense]MBR0836998.1 hypothetical protein [Bradyrhizobium manausense]
MLPDSITSVLLAALNAADEAVERDSTLTEPISAEAAPAAQALANFAKLSMPDFGEDRPNRFAATICLSMEKFKSAS